MQKALLMGWVGNTPEERHTSGGRKVTTFRLGVTGKLKGEKNTTWYTIQCWDSMFKHILPYIKKGTALLVGGELIPPHMFEGRDGPKIGLNVNAQSVDFCMRNEVDEQSTFQEEMPF